MKQSVMRSALVLSAVVLLAACGKSKVATAPADVPVLIVANDSGFTVPDTLRAGLNHFVYENHGKDVHECMFIHLPAGMSTADFVAQVKSGVDFPAGALDCSGPGLTSPGERVEMWVPLEEGDYMIGCWLGDHMTTRQPVTFVVHGQPETPVSAPRENVTVRMSDFRFTLVGKLARGEQVIRYQTLGPSMHEVDVIRLGEGKTVEDVRAYFKNEGGTPPGTLGGGSMDSHDLNRETWVRLDLVPGRYVLWCDMPMIQSTEKTAPDAPHVTHADAGMVQEVVID